MFSSDATSVWVHLYGACNATLELDGHPIGIRQTTAYPWDGNVNVTLSLNAPADFVLALRIPGWVRDPQLLINGEMQALDAHIENGYARLSRTWRDGDQVLLDLPMPVERIHAHPRVRHNCGRIALQRGPVVYCLEEVDNGPDLAALSLPAEERFEVTTNNTPFGGVPVIRGTACRLDSAEWENRLYRSGPGGRARRVSTPFTAVPYCLWASREVGEMTVWVRESLD